MKTAVVLTAHGTVESLDDLAPFISQIRRGRPAPPEVVAEVRHRYEAIGGQSPLLAASRELAKKVEAKLGVPTKIAMRLWHPFPAEVVPELAKDGFTKIAVVPLAQFSASIYGDAIAKAAKDVEAAGGPSITVRCTENWGLNPGLVTAQAKRVQNAIDAIAPEHRKNSRIIFSAHSLPKFLIDQGDSYEVDFRASVAAIVQALGPNLPPHFVCFQSQGMSAPGERTVEWLGPNLQLMLDDVKASGASHVVFAPVGFLADHVEILFDLDIEAKAWATERGLTSSRIESLNAADDFVDVIAGLAAPLLLD
ncbi:MAG: ferrochelatase [Polyangiaceae bacterium]